MCTECNTGADPLPSVRGRGRRLEIFFRRILKYIFSGVRSAPQAKILWKLVDNSMFWLKEIVLSLFGT